MKVHFVFVSATVLFFVSSMGMPLEETPRNGEGEGRGLIPYNFIPTGLEHWFLVGIVRCILNLKLLLLSLPGCHLCQKEITITTTIEPNTTQPTTTPLPDPTQPKNCTNQNDLYILIDGSSSITYVNFKQSLEFTSRIVLAWKRHYSNRIAVAVFASNVQEIIGIVESSILSPEIIQRRILNTPYPKGSTMTNLGLEYTTKNIKSNPRKSTRNMLLLTDGGSDDETKTRTAAMELLSTGAETFSVGVGNYNIDELLFIAGNHPAHVFTVDAFHSLLQVLLPLSETICD